MHPMITLHYFVSRRQAMQVRALLARQSGNGGLVCYFTFREENGTHSLRFCGRTYAELNPGMAPPNPSILQGWIRGYLYAVETAKRTLKELR